MYINVTEFGSEVESSTFSMTTLIHLFSNNTIISFTLSIQAICPI